MTREATDPLLIQRIAKGVEAAMLGVRSEEREGITVIYLARTAS